MSENRRGDFLTHTVDDGGHIFAEECTVKCNMLLCKAEAYRPTLTAPAADDPFRIGRYIV